MKYVNKKLPKRGVEIVPKEVLDSIELDSLRIQKIWESIEKENPLNPDGDGILDPPNPDGGGTIEDEKDLLSHIVKYINENYGKDLNEEDRVELNRLFGKINEDQETIDIITGDNSTSNKKDFFKKRVDDYFLDLINNRFELYKKMEDQRMKDYIYNTMFNEMVKRNSGQVLNK